MPKKKGLTFKQEKFCLEYVRTANATTAYERAYDSENMKRETMANKAYVLMKKDYISARIDDLKRDLAKTMGVEKMQLIAILQEVINRSLRGEAVMIYDKDEKCMVPLQDEDGHIIYQYDQAGVNRAVAELNKMLGHYEPEKVDHTTDGQPIQPMFMVAKSKSNIKTDKPE